MATREEVYCKFGITAEAGQLFETELGTLLLSAKGMMDGWHITPDVKAGRKLVADIDRHTLGQMLTRVKDLVTFEEGLDLSLMSALKARNRLNHGFYERHNFRIDTDEGRDLMIDDLEALHIELFDAWRIVSAMTATTLACIVEQKKTTSPKD